MNTEVVESTIKGVMPTAQGCAIFLGPSGKTFVIYVDQGIGKAISDAINGEKRERPLTHDLIMNTLAGFGATLERIIINDVDKNTFFARIIAKMENELGTKLVEIDARPSDSMVLALLAKKPIFVAHRVLDSVDDMTEILERIMKQQQK